MLERCKPAVSGALQTKRRGAFSENSRFASGRDSRRATKYVCGRTKRRQSQHLVDMQEMEERANQNEGDALKRTNHWRWAAIDPAP